jgi:uncharacterized repeat protein (TIGR01451 family)
MAGKLGLAAKLFLGSTMLASGGVGAWYVTANGWPVSNGTPTDGAVAELDAQQSSAADRGSAPAADLDALASAWSEPASPTATVAADSSPVARSADSALARTEDATPTPPPPPVDRYDALAAVPPNEPTTPDDNEDELEPMPANGPQAADAFANELSADAPTAPPTPEETAPSSQALARGQEPKEESEPDHFADVATDSAEIQPLKSSGQSPGTGAASDRAREAFRDDVVGPAGDRYGASATPTPPPAAERNNSGIVNPFGPGSAAGTPAVSAQTSDTIGPLPAPPDQLGGQPTELRDAGDRMPKTNRFARSADGGSFENQSGSQRIQPYGNAADAEIGGSLRSSEPSLPSDGDAQSLAGDGTGRPGEKALEGPQKPALEIQKFAPGEIQVGKPAKFVVQVRNIGSQAAEDVTIRDEVPHGTRLVSTSPTAETNASQVFWQLGKLSPGEDRTVEMQLMPALEGEIGSVATVSYSAQASVKTRCTEPQLAIRMTAPSKVMVGQQQRVKIELRNPGSGDATGVMLLENVPQNLKHAGGPALEFEIGTLRAGETRELELVLLAEKAGKVVNVLSARAEGNLQVQQQVEFEVIAPALSVDVNGPERRYLERPATYEVSVENPGTAPAHDVQIVTKLPKGMRFVRANNMGEYDAATHAVYWSLAELPEGERGTVELVAMPIEAGPQTLEVESRAGEGLSDQTQRQIVVDGLAAIMFEVRDLEDPIEVGGETGYEIRVVNQGTKAATNLQVAISLPPGLQLVSAEGETQHSDQRGAIVFEPLPQLAPKADTVFRVRAQGIAAGDQRVTVEVNTDDLAQPIRREESTRVFGDE